MPAMTEHAAARRLRLLEALSRDQAGNDLLAYATEFEVDERTIRRDVDYLQDLLASVEQVGMRRGRLYATREGHGPGYFSDQLAHNQEIKRALARAVVETLTDNLA